MTHRFEAGLKPHYECDPRDFTVRIEQLNITAAYGSAIIAAKLERGLEIPRPNNPCKMIAEIHCPDQIIDSNHACMPFAKCSFTDRNGSFIN
ncbi:hypothetical protein Ciccas_000522 [Cichlidogyrus casuarinus]|uniref:Uncharacterized protein n=1 Tax=Cichlidogyrus casuarinus TaxID=1844966 RepID=A0ABD2QMP0_9PLAT